MASEQEDDPTVLAREAAAVLATALARLNTLHLPGVRALHREELQEAIRAANRALMVSSEEEVCASARSTLVKAHAARARDARHGAGQLSLGAQRAPTREDCEDGWQRVEELVAVAEESAREAAQLAIILEHKVARRAAEEALTAAQEARRIVEERNHAYTFHCDTGFSFGEGWYVAAAALLDDIFLQIEPDKPLTTRAERFLHDAGLAHKIVPYRSRPRANKPLPLLVAQAFRRDAMGAQRKLRDAFLGNEACPEELARWIDETLARVTEKKKVLLWVRSSTHHPMRNTTLPELLKLIDVCLAVGVVPVLVGDALPGAVPAEAVDLTLFWKRSFFQNDNQRRAQLQFFEHLRSNHALLGQLGVTSAGMDGPALLGLPTLYLTDAPNVRLGNWVGAVPEYNELVRSENYLEQVRERIMQWTHV